MSDLEKEIELYLDGEMTPEQKVVFEEKIKKNPQLQKDINTYQEMYTVYNNTDWNIVNPTVKNRKLAAYEVFLKSEKGKTIADSITNAENVYFEEKKSPNVRGWIAYGSAIAAIFVIGLFVLFQFINNIEVKSLYAEYKNWDNLPSLTLRNTNTDLATAERFFKEQNYKEALSIFLQHQSLDSQDLNPQILIYTGVTQLELDQNEAAIKTFERLLYSNTLDASKANWYLALTYLKMDNINKAKERLQVILDNPKNYQYQKAKDLLNSL